MGPIINSASQVQCLHGGQAILLTANSNVLVDGTLAQLESDVHLVIGCPFTVGPKYSPCLRIEWVLGASRVTQHGTPVLVQTSLGKCINAEGAIQGLAVIVNTQTKVITG